MGLKMGALKVFVLAMCCVLLPLGCGESQDERTPRADPRTVAGEGDKPPTQTGATFYVSPQGDNANPGTREKPWATPGHGSRQLKPGDTLVILGGKYVLREYDDDILVPPSGNPDGWIVIKGEVNNRPVLAGRDNLAMAVDLRGASYIWFENLEITHDSDAKAEAVQFRDGIVGLERPSSHVVLKDLYIHHIDEFAVNLQDIDHLRVLNCRLEYTGFGSLGGPTGAHGGWRNVLIKGCRLSYNGHYYQAGNGDNRPYDRPDGFGIEESNGPIEIAETVAEHNRGDGLDSKAANTYIHNCIVANNSCDGVKLWGTGSRIENTLIYGRCDGDKEATPWSAIVMHTENANAEFEMVNVTVDDELGENYVMHVQYDTPDIPIRLDIRNSIFRATGPRSPLFIGQATVLTITNSLFCVPNSEAALQHGDAAYTADTIGKVGTGNRYGDPLFVAPAWGKEGDYHLKPGSPAIDAGTSQGAPATDMEGKPRPQGKGFDIGAYEQ